MHLREKGNHKKWYLATLTILYVICMKRFTVYILCQCPASPAWRSCQTPTWSLVSGCSVWLDLGWWSWSAVAPSQSWERCGPGGDPGMSCSYRSGRTDEIRELKRGTVLGVCPRNIRVSLKSPESSERLRRERRSQLLRKLCENLTHEKKIYKKGHIFVMMPSSFWPLHLSTVKLNNHVISIQMNYTN